MFGVKQWVLCHDHRLCHSPELSTWGDGVCFADPLELRPLTCIFFTFVHCLINFLPCRPFRKKSRVTSLVSMTFLRGVRTLSQRAAPMLKSFSRDLQTWSSCGTFSLRRRRSATSAWRSLTGLSSITSMQPRLRPGWVSKSSTWCQKRKPRWAAPQWHYFGLNCFAGGRQVT